MARRPRRLVHVAGIGVDRMGELADAATSDFLRLENLNVDIPPDAEAIERTRRALAEDDANSYLPFTGRLSLRRAAARHVSALSGVDYSGERNCVISAGGLSGILNVLLATVETGDEVIVTDPTYAGLINRIRLAGGVPKFTPFVFTPGAEWRLDREKLRAAIGANTRAMLLMSPSMPSGAISIAETGRSSPSSARRMTSSSSSTRRWSGSFSMGAKPSTRPAFRAWRSAASPSARPRRSCA